MPLKKIFIAILYKTSASDSLTVNSFIKLKLADNPGNYFVVWDNSPYKINSESDVKKLLNTENMEFIHTPENTALSKVYNYCLDKYDFCDLICLFDQDSEIRQKDYDLYIDKVVTENPNINIFLPKIYSKEKLYSPGRFWFFKGWHYKELSYGIHSDKFYTAVMSGCIARIQFLKANKIRFNEDLTLYGIDTSFFIDSRKFDSYYFVMETDFRHNLSEESLTGQKKKEQIKKYIKAYKIISKKKRISILIINLYELALRILGKI